MDWTAAKAGLLTWAAALFDEPVIVTWADEAQPQNPGRPVVRIGRNGHAFMGTPSSEWTHDPIGRSSTETAHVQGFITLTLSMESTDARLGTSPFALLEKAALRSQLEESTSALDALGFGHTWVNPAGLALATWTTNGRSYPRASFDIRLAYMASVTGAPIETIERVGVRVDVELPNGADLPPVLFDIPDGA